ncbi:MAG: hypothetical protein IJK52_12910 [Oscillospiraceae bacterium]|nr:hypothetical protein [Oscillospiraceae bacterium]
MYTDAYSSERELQEATREAVETVRADTARKGPDAIFPEHAFAAQEPDAFAKSATYLRRYLQIHTAVLSEKAIGGENCVLALSSCLDALELMRTFPGDNQYDPFRFMFANQSVIYNAGNLLIKQSGLFPEKDNFLVNREGNIRSVPDIARTSQTPNLKRECYYAVVYADGDNLTSFLNGLKTPSHIRRFSKGCLAYDRKAARRISAYGGMPVYAGGDDLLFLAPLSGQNGQSVASFCQSLRNLFLDTLREEFADEDASGFAFPTMSFGVAVQFEKFPLYEAFERARQLLKMAKSGEKDNILLELRKHSGQSAALLIHNPDAQAFEELCKAARGDDVDGEKPTALLYTLEHFHAVVSVLIANARKRLEAGEHPDALKEEFLSAWGNLFDNPGQTVSEEYAKGVGEAYFTRLLSGNGGVTVPGHAAPGGFFDNSLKALVNVLTWEKFMKEKASEQERAEAGKKP